MADPRGIVAAGHPLTAEAGARVLRAGGNAVDAALGAMLVSWVAEPLLTGPGAGGYMLVAGGDDEPTLLDFFVAAPGDGADPGDRAALLPVDVSFGDAHQVFYVGAASVGVPGCPAGVAEAARRWGSVPLADLAAPAAALAREGVPVAPEQAYIFEILEPDPVHDARGTRGLRARGPRAARRASASRRPSSPRRSSVSAPRGRRPSTPATSPRPPSRPSPPAAACSPPRTSPPTPPSPGGRCAWASAAARS